MKFTRFEDCEVWQMGRELVKEVYSLTRAGEFAKDFGLKDQLQRAAVSISSNVAEGYARRGNKEFVKFLWIAKGSAAEVQSQLYHAKDLGYIEAAHFEKLYNSSNLIQVKLYHLIQSLTTSLTRQKV